MIALPPPREETGMPLAGRRVAVLGLGRSGLASAHFLAAHGAEVLGCDESPDAAAGAALDAAGIAVHVGPTTWADLGDPEVLVVSPGVRLDHPLPAAARRAGAEVIGEIELAYRFCRAPLTAVAGTNGKGSATTMLGAMLAAAGKRVVVAGNIGTPLVSVIEGEWDIVVAEVSSFQLETVVDFRPWAATLLNVTPDHMDRHLSFDAYVAAKTRLFGNQRAGDLAVLNLDDPVVCGLAGSIGATCLGVSLSRGDCAGRVVGDELVVALPDRPAVTLCHRDDLFVGGPHYLVDALCAGVVAVAAGCGPQDTVAGLRAWRPTAHLLTEVAIVSGVRFVDDSKATNPGAAAADLDTLTEPFWVIAGGQAKGLDLGGFANKLAATARGVFLIGEAARELVTLLSGRVPATVCGTIETAVQRAYQAAGPGETVILAPACASFDQFQGQAERGDRFVAAVAALQPKERP